MSPHNCAYRGHAPFRHAGRGKRDTPMGCCPACLAAPLRKAEHCGTLSRLSRVSRTANLHRARARIDVLDNCEARAGRAI